MVAELPKFTVLCLWHVSYSFQCFQETLAGVREMKLYLYDRHYCVFLSFFWVKGLLWISETVMSTNPILWSQPVLHMSCFRAGQTLGYLESKKREQQSHSCFFIFVLTYIWQKNVKTTKHRDEFSFPPSPLLLQQKYPAKQALCQSNFGLAWMDHA